MEAKFNVTVKLTAAQVVEALTAYVQEAMPGYIANSADAKIGTKCVGVGINETAYTCFEGYEFFMVPKPVAHIPKQPR